jgi:hypothetical protein
MSLQSWRPWAERVGATTAAEVLAEEEANIAGGMFVQARVEWVKTQSPKGVVAMLLGLSAGRTKSSLGSCWELGSGLVPLLLIGVYIYIHISIYIYIYNPPAAFYN